MKKMFLFAICTFIAFTAQAQSNTDEVALLQSVYGLEKKQLIVNYMKLTDAEAAKFWPLYDKYEIARKELGAKRIANVVDYANNAANLTNEKASELTINSLELYKAFAKLQETTFKHMSTAITPLRAAQWVQVEIYLENVIRMEVADEIPMIGELEDAKK